MVGLILLGVLAVVFGSAALIDWRGRRRKHRPWAGREIADRQPDVRLDVPDVG